MEIKIKVITPAGCVYVDSISEAQEMKKLYGYLYVVERTEDE